MVPQPQLQRHVLCLLYLPTMKISARYEFLKEGASPSSIAPKTF